MTDDQFQNISRVLADGKRFAMLKQIAAERGGLCCGSLEEHAHLSAATISHHLKELADAGVVIARREGRRAHLSLDRKVWRAYLRRLSSIA